MKTLESGNREVGDARERTSQAGLFEQAPVDHPVAAAFEEISAWLDSHREALDWVAADVDGGCAAEAGRQGLTAETILRCGLLRQLRQESWRELAFALAATVGSVKAETWERIGLLLLADARAAGFEDGSRVRMDSTVTRAHILSPTDSGLLRDGVRVLARELQRARERLGADAVRFKDHRRAAKRRHLEIRSRRGEARRRESYRKLLRLAERTVGYAEEALPAASASGAAWAPKWAEKVEEIIGLVRRVADQARRRVLDGERVPALEKVASLFEPHMDIVVKGGRGTQYGHKLNLSTGRSGLVLDAVVEDGNPADAAKCVPMLERHVERCGQAPSRAAFDGGCASKANLAAAKAMGVEHAVFQKKRGMEDAEMSPSAWIRRALWRFRAGVEAGISHLKRCFGLGLCRWRGLPRFKAWVQSAVLAHNLARFAALRIDSG